jgi:flagellar basal-body rod protein FlgB
LAIHRSLTDARLSAGVNLNDSPYFATLRTRLEQLGERQSRIAENIANASTPGFVPNDVDTRRFEEAVARAASRTASGRLTMTRTHEGHMPLTNGAWKTPARTISRPDSETTLDGNAVVLEEQTMRAAETRMAYEMNLALYQKGLQLVRLAGKPPGR